MEKDMLTRIKKQRLEAMKRQAQTRRHADIDVLKVMKHM